MGVSDNILESKSNLYMNIQGKNKTQNRKHWQNETSKITRLYMNLHTPKQIKGLKVQLFTEIKASPV